MSADADIAPTRRSTAWDVTKDMWREINEDGLFDAAAGVAFWLLLSIPAALLAVLSAVSLLGDGLTADLQASINVFVDRTFTTESTAIRDAVDELFSQSRPGVLSVSVAIAVFTLSRGFAGLIRALDIAYDVNESRRFIRLRLTAIGLAIGTMVTVAAATSVWVALRKAGVPTIVSLLAEFVILIAWASTLFHIAPHHRTPWKFDLPGATLAATSWLLVSFGFGHYVRFASSGNEFVGAASTALLALTWLWLTCLVFLIGAELNEIIAARADVVSAPRQFGIDIKGRVTQRVERVRRRKSEIGQ